MVALGQWALGASYLASRYLLQRKYLVAHASFFDLRLKFRVEDAIGRHLYKRGAIERTITDYLVRSLAIADGELAFDVGANIGWYSLILDRLAAPSARIFAFEPDPESFALLEENLAANAAARVRPVERALSDGEGEQALYRYTAKNSGRHSLVPRAGGEQVRVTVTSLDAYRSRVGAVGPVAFAKIDVEGWELAVIRGAQQTLSEARLVLVELSPPRMRAVGHSPEEAIERLFGAGLTPRQVTPGGLVEVARADLLEARATNTLWVRAPSR